MIATAAKILVAEDEPVMRNLLRSMLATQGYTVTEAADGKSALQAVNAGEQPADLLLLDLMLPDISGLKIIEKLRASGSSLPIIVLSNRGDEDAKVTALDLGANDYVTKPVGSRELFARIRASMRRQPAWSVFRSGDLEIDFLSRNVTLSGQDLKLSPKEYCLLAFLAKNVGKALTHSQILKEVWSNETDTQYIRIYIRSLRQKLRDAPENPRYIMTEQGVGYRFRDPHDID